MQARNERFPEDRPHVRAEVIGTKPKSRVPSVDALRGLVMIIMALDHVRDFFHSGAMYFQPDNLARTTVPLFFTRWITHFCAPGICIYWRPRSVLVVEPRPYQE